VLKGGTRIGVRDRSRDRVKEDEIVEAELARLGVDGIAGREVLIHAGQG